MDEFITIKHSFNCGDLISIMAGLKQLYMDIGKKIIIYQQINLEAYFYDGQINSTLNNSGNSVCMNERLFSLLKPLIESQEYIERFEVWKGEKVMLDYDLTRDSKSIPMPSGLIHSWYEAIFPQTSTDLSQKWVHVEQSSIKKDYYKDKIIINRTQRYTNPYISYYFLKEYQDKILFSGTEAEHSFFCSQWDLDLKLVQTDNFYQLAQIISWCKFGIYNQSMNFHIADAMKSKRVLELCYSFPNTFITGANGYQFYGQKSLEYYFHKLNN